MKRNVRQPQAIVSCNQNPTQKSRSLGRRIAPGFVRTALNWLSQNVGHFLPPPNETTHTARLKPLAEIALMLYCYVRLTRDQSNRAVTVLTRLLQRVQRNAAFSELPVHSPDDFVPICDVYAALRLMGHDCLEQRAILERVVSSGILSQIDRPPQGHMEVRLSAQTAALNVACLPDGPYPVAIPASVLIDDSLAYALTHTIMFRTDFGERPDRLRADGALADRLTMLIVRYCRERHYDLLAECLLCWDAVRLEPTTLTKAAWKVLLRGQTNGGAFPAKAEAEYRGTPVEASPEADDLRFRRQYHTTIICVIAGSLRTRNGAIECDRARRRTWRPSFGLTNVSSKDVASSFSRGLRSLVYPAPQEADSAILCYQALGAWIGTITPSRSCTRFLDSSLAALVEHETRKPLASIDIPITLKMLVAALLSARGLTSPSLTRLLNHVIHALRTDRRASESRDLAFEEKRLLLHALGLHCRPRHVRYSEIVRAAKRTAMYADDESVDDLLLRIECASEYGTRPMVVRPADRWMRELLAGVAQHWLRGYAWAKACRAVRALIYLNLSDGPGFEGCLSFMIQHQTPGGKFGFFGRQLGDASSESTDEGSCTPAEVAVTVECLWTLAESNRQRKWRLYAGIPRLDSRVFDQYASS